MLSANFIFSPHITPPGIIVTFFWNGPILHNPLLVSLRLLFVNQVPPIPQTTKHKGEEQNKHNIRHPGPLAPHVCEHDNHRPAHQHAQRHPDAREGQLNAVLRLPLAGEARQACPLAREARPLANTRPERRYGRGFEWLHSDASLEEEEKTGIIIS